MPVIIDSGIDVFKALALGAMFAAVPISCSRPTKSTDECVSRNSFRANLNKVERFCEDEKKDRAGAP